MISDVISIVPLPQINRHTRAGEKARNLFLLLKMGCKVPKTFVIPFEAFEEYKRDRISALKSIENLLEGALDETNQYSVRSSANVEDSPMYSFAGQFTTLLNLTGLAPVKDAIEDTWDSSHSEHVNAYKSGLGHAGPPNKMAVIIQEMVTPDFSGVVFTTNPITGLDEVIVETVDGYGDALVQEGATPDRWVHKWGDWLECPDEKKDRESIILEVIKVSKEIADKIGSPVDLEWAYDGQEIQWLQMRKITTLMNTNIYSNRLSREYLPGIIVPLVWSVNIPVVNSSWKRLFIELMGSSAKGIDTDNLARSFFYRAYFNMGVIGDIFEMLGLPRGALEILAGIEVPAEGKPSFRPGLKTIRYLPRMISVMIRKLFFSKEIELFLRSGKKAYQEISGIDVASLDLSATLEIIECLFELNTDASYFVIVSQLLNSIYNMALRAQLEKRGIILDKIEFKETKKSLCPIDPNQQICLLHREYMLLDSDKQELLKNATWETAVHAKEIGPFREGLVGFLRRFGHLSDSGNDFSKPTWREDPAIIIKMVTGHGDFTLDHEENLEQSRLEAALKESRTLRMLFHRAAKFREYRESVNFLYTYGYGLFRRFFKRMESLLVQRGRLESTDDMFYLTYNETKLLLNDVSNVESLRRKIAERKEEIKRFTDVSLPDVIYNELPESALVKEQVISEMRGVATSRGHYIGPARVVRGHGDFDKIQMGDVLVIPYSDVSWTPLFSKAAAVVSESGGILSHCSIVAREYGIPAVVSVRGATDLLDGTTIAVDGYRGEVQIIEE